MEADLIIAVEALTKQIKELKEELKDVNYKLHVVNEHLSTMR